MPSPQSASRPLRPFQVTLGRIEQQLSPGLVGLQIQNPAKVLEDASEFEGVWVIRFELERPVCIFEPTGGPLGVERFVESVHKVGLPVRQPATLDGRSNPLWVKLLHLSQYRIRCVQTSPSGGGITGDQEGVDVLAQFAGLLNQFPGFGIRGTGPDRLEVDLLSQALAKKSETSRATSSCSAKISSLGRSRVFFPISSPFAALTSETLTRSLLPKPATLP